MAKKKITHIHTHKHIYIYKLNVCIINNTICIQHKGGMAVDQTRGTHVEIFLFWSAVQCCGSGKRSEESEKGFIPSQLII